MMNCEQSQERMIDVLYGEEVTPRQGFEFFQHLSECPNGFRKKVMPVGIHQRN